MDAVWQSLRVDCKSLSIYSTFILIMANCFLDRSVIVPADEAEALSLRPGQVKINQKYGGGFPANVEGLHQLHYWMILIISSISATKTNHCHRISSANSSTITMTITTPQEKALFQTPTTLCTTMSVSILRTPLYSIFFSISISPSPFFTSPQN